MLKFPKRQKYGKFSDFVEKEFWKHPPVLISKQMTPAAASSTEAGAKKKTPRLKLKIANIGKRKLQKEN